MAIAELVSTLEISPRLARPMKMTPSTASRIGAILLAKKVRMSLVAMPPLGSSGAAWIASAIMPRVGVAWFHAAWTSSMAIIRYLPGARPALQLLKPY